MAAHSPRAQGLLDLWAAHRELTTLEWLEFRQTVWAAAGWLMCMLIGALAAWLALNAAALIAFREQPLRAALAVAAINFAGAALAGWQAHRLLHRPFFAVTKREVGRDVGTLFKVIS